MKRTFFSIIAIGLMLCSTSFLYAGAGRTNPFLVMERGTRATALGDAFVAVSGDATAAFWNPSGLYGIKKPEAILAYTDYKTFWGEAGEGLYYAVFAGALPAGDWGVIATTLRVNGQGTMEITGDSPDVLRTESVGTNWAWALAYSDELFPNFLGGVTFRIIRQKFVISGRAYAVDLGAQYHLKTLPLPISLGASVQNWGTRIHFKDANQSDSLPRTFKYGAGLTLLKSKYQRLQIVGDFTASIDKLKEDEEGLEEAVNERFESNPEGKTKDEIRKELEAQRGAGINAFRYDNMVKSLGAEYWFGDERIALALRMGYKEEPSIYLPDIADRFAYGIGIRVINYQFDYASTPGGGPDNKRRNTFALVIRF